MGGRMWTETELDFIHENYHNMTNAEMADHLGREESGVQLKVNRLGLKGENGRKPRRRDTYAGNLPKVGDRFGKLTIQQVLETPGYTTCICECDCHPGVTFERRLSDLKARNNHSCGCEKIIKAVERFTTHGKSKTDIYKHWNKMKDRCYNKNHSDYHNYGGRGISLSNEWLDFENFYQWAIQGYEEGKTIHRNDNNKGYSHDNCTWATPKEQANSRRNNRLLTAFGETKTVAQWSEDPRAAVGEMTIRYRIDNGWDDYRAITTPPGISPNRNGKPSTVSAGDVYGKLTILSCEYKKKGKQNAIYCYCQCECGNKTHRWGSELSTKTKRGVIVSCGCARTDLATSRITAYNQRYKP